MSEWAFYKVQHYHKKFTFFKQQWSLKLFSILLFQSKKFLNCRTVGLVQWDPKSGYLKTKNIWKLEDIWKPDIFMSDFRMVNH